MNPALLITIKVCQVIKLTCTKPWGTLQWCLFGPLWRLVRETVGRLCATWSRSLWLGGHYQQRVGRTWWWVAAQQNTGSGSKRGPSLWCWRQPVRQKFNTMVIILGCTTQQGPYRTTCLRLTVSREAAALMSGRKPTSSTWSRKSWLSIPYTLSRNRTMGALWSGTKLADIFGSIMLLSKKTFWKNH